MDETYLIVDGKTERWKITAFTRLSVEKNMGSDADEFRAEFPIDAEALARLQNIKGETVRIYWAGVHVFSGFADEVSYTFSATGGLSAGLLGRDFTGFLIDKKLSSALANRLRGRTAGGAVELVAKEYGYDYDIMPGTSAHPDLFHEGLPIWSVVSDLAEKEGADAWCDKDKVIHFRRVEPGEPKRSFRWPTDKISRLSLNQDLTSMMGLRVTVEGYDPRGKRKIKAIAETPEAQRNEIAEITVRDPNAKTPLLAKTVAAAKLRELSARFLTGEMELEPDPALEVGDTISLDGVGWLSGRYLVSGITLTRRAEAESMTVRFRHETLARMEVKSE